LLENLFYGGGDSRAEGVGQVLEQADLFGVIQRLPDGMQTALGEGGGLVSGGEGQRVRFGRALGRSRARLVILDEPFRGLDHGKRKKLLEQARRLWRDATLLCITHDVGETRDFARVLVLDGGRILEDASPPDLASKPASHYRGLLDSETTVRTGLWSSHAWRRLRIENGQLQDGEK
jgi:ATP-binding cassette subfamily B protein